MHTFPPLYDLFRYHDPPLTPSAISTNARGNVRGNPVSPLLEAVHGFCRRLRFSLSFPLSFSLYWLYWLPRSETDDLIPCRFTHRFLRFRIIYQHIRYNRFNCAGLILSLSRTRSSLGSFPSDWTWPRSPPLFPWIESKIASIREFLSQNRYWFGNVSAAAWNNPFLPPLLITILRLWCIEI